MAADAPAPRQIDVVDLEGRADSCCARVVRLLEYSVDRGLYTDYNAHKRRCEQSHSQLR